MKDIEYVTVDGEVVTSDGDPVFVTVESVLKYIDQSQVAINKEIRGDIRSWFQNHFDLSETINNATSFIIEVYTGLYRSIQFIRPKYFRNSYKLNP